MDWVDKRETEIKDERAKGYFGIVEGKQNFILLSHTAPLAQVYDNAAKKYRAAEEGEKGASIRGVCWILQEGVIKEAKLPYVVVKSIRALQQNPEWEFELPFPHTFTLEAIGAGTKEVKYSLTASPKKIEIPAEILDELKKKPSPEEIIEKIKGGSVETPSTENISEFDYPESDIDPSNIPF